MGIPPKSKHLCCTSLYSVYTLKLGAVDIFRVPDMSHLFWSQIRNWLGMSLHKVNSFLTKTRKTSLCQRQGLRPFAIFGLRAYERHASHRPPTANGRFSYVESWRCHKGKP